MAKNKGEMGGESLEKGQRGSQQRTLKLKIVLNESEGDGCHGKHCQKVFSLRASEGGWKHILFHSRESVRVSQARFLLNWPGGEKVGGRGTRRGGYGSMLKTSIGAREKKKSVIPQHGQGERRLDETAKSSYLDGEKQAKSCYSAL